MDDTMKWETDETKLNHLAAEWGLLSMGGRGAIVDVWDEDNVLIMWSGVLAYVTDDGWAGILDANGRLDEAPAARVFRSVAALLS